jgi:Zn-dependent M16 (insulinase) family peptidase
MLRKFYATLLYGICLLTGFGLQPAVAQINKTSSFKEFKSGQVINGFKSLSIYLNDADRPIGGRFVHLATGFKLDLLQMESVPQSFVYVNSFPVSDKGEPHTQEHLLITKGNKGHYVNTLEGMSLAESNAFTAQLHTTYNFNTAGDSTVFYNLFGKLLDALLYPDYTDEEVNREVRNWGITQNPDKTLRLEEKGAVYNEMSTSMSNPYALLFDELSRMQYGKNHPNAYNSGGLPADIRILNANDISAFHKKNYYLANMGAIVSLPKSIGPGPALFNLDRILTQLNQQAPKTAHVPDRLPLVKPAENGKITMVEYPSENAQQPGTVLISFAPTLTLTPLDLIEINTFLTIFSGDATTNLYKIFVDSKTKIPDFDAQTLYGYADFKQGYPVNIFLDGVSAVNLTREKVMKARELVIQELKKVAAYPDHSPELLKFSRRFENNQISYNRFVSKIVNSPPKFGFRDTGDSWYDQLRLLEEVPGYKKSLTLKPITAEIDKQLKTGINIWKPLLGKLNLEHNLPFVVYSKASTTMAKQSELERKARTDAEVARLKDFYHTKNDQEAIKLYKTVYDSNTQVLEKLEKNNSIKFIQTPPLTLDDQLVYKQQLLTGKIPELNAVFDNMTSATTGIALDLKHVPRDKMVYLAIFPSLLTETGIIKNGKAIPYEEMIQRIQREILTVKSYYSTNGNTGRAELIINAAGNNQAEALKAVEWIGDVLQQPNWTTGNLPRIRDLVDQNLTSIRKTMQGSEESWVRDPQRALLFQDQPLQLATNSFLTRTFNIFRLKWMLKGPGSPADSSAFSTWVASLSKAEANRGDLKKLFNVINSTTPLPADSAGLNKKYATAYNQLPAGSQLLVRSLALDLDQMLSDIPDNALAGVMKRAYF